MEHPADVIEDGNWGDPESLAGHLENSSLPCLSVILTATFVLMFAASTALNTIFLVIFFRKPSLRNISNRFIVSLTVSNLVSAWILLPLVVADILHKKWALIAPDSDFSAYLSLYQSSSALCTTFNVVADFTTSASVFSTVLIAFDRFFAITDPLHYHMLVTKCRSWIFIGLGWFLACLIAAFSGVIGDGEGKWNVCEVRTEPIQGLYYWGHLTFAITCFVICFALPFVMLAWAYAKIYAAAQQNSERARRSSLCNPTLEVMDATKSVSRSSSTRSTSSQIVSTIRRRISNASLFLYKEEARAAKISVGVIVLFLLCWFPYYLTKIIYATFGEDTVPLYIFKIVLVFTVMNSIISPYVYMYRSKRIQREVLRLFGFTPKTKRKEFERRRPIYHQLSANLEKIPASPICLEGDFKLESQQAKLNPEFNDQFDEKKPNLPKVLYKKILYPLAWKSTLFSSSCISSSSASSPNSSCQTSYVSSNINSSTQNLSSILPVNSNIV